MNETLLKMIRDAKSELLFIGTASLTPGLDTLFGQLTDLMILNDGLRITVLYESDSELFSQSLLFGVAQRATGSSFEKMRVHRDRVSGTIQGGGLKSLIQERLVELKADPKIANRVVVKQTNLRLPYNVIKCDELLLVSVTGCCPSSTESYRLLAREDPIFNDAVDLIQALVNSPRGQEFLAGPNSEYLQLYDNDGIPRGVYPRSCFYTTAYQRQSVWGFIFNRKGQILLHQRSKHTKDGRELWDKSIGGHVDLTDSSTFITAQRELIEELFLPEAEYTRYMKADLGDIINFGDWNPQKRIERTFQGAFAGLKPADWIMFTATDKTGAPLTVMRKSERRINISDEKTVIRPTRFISDVYLFIAPEGYIDSPEEMDELFKRSEESGAALDHKLATVEELADWINKCEEQGIAKTTFTDDLQYINTEHRDMLERFAEFVKYSFNQ
jgi:NUDIX domain